MKQKEQSLQNQILFFFVNFRENRYSKGYEEELISMKTEQQYFEQGTSMKDYMDNMSQLKEESFAIYDAFEVPNNNFIEKLKAANVHILTITEDWCGDAMLNNPIIRKIAEAADVEIRTVLRDEDTDLIDRHLTNGGRAIPIYIVLNEAGEVVAKWGPRAPKLQEMVMEGRAKLPTQDDEGFAEAQKQFYIDLRSSYVSDSNLWLEVYESFKEAVEKL